MDARGELVELPTNRVLSLDAPGGKWEVESGLLALFLCELDRDGARHPLITVGPGDLLLAVPRALGTRYGLKAVAIDACRLRYFDTEGASQALAANPGPESRRYLDLIQRIGAALPLFTEALSDVPSRTMDGDWTVELEPGQTFRAHRSSPCWARIEDGEALFMGMPDAVVDSGFAAFPAVPRFWMVAKTKVRIALRSCLTADDLTTKRKGVLETHLPHYLEILAAQTAENTRERFRQREEQVNNRLRASVERIGRILDPQLSAIPADWPALAKACAVIGRFQGVQFRPPRAFDEASGEDAVLAIARASCVRARRITLDGEWLREAATPFLAFRKNGSEPDKTEFKPVALLPRAGGGYECYDPERDQRAPLDDVQAKSLASQGYVFYTPLPSGAVTARSLLSLIWQTSRSSVLAIALYGLGVTLFSLAIPEANRALVEDAIPAADERLVLQTGLALAAVVLSIGLFSLAQGYATLRLNCRIDHTVQSGLMDRVLRLSTGFFRRFATGDLVLRVMAMQQIQELVSAATLRSLLSGLVSVATLAVLFSYNAQLALAAVGMGAACYAVTLFYSIRMYRVGGGLLEMRGANFGLVVELLGGISKLRVAGAERRAFAFWADRYATERELSLRQRAFQDRMEWAMRAIGTGSVLVLLVLGAPLFSRAENRMGTGEFLAFYFAFGQFMAGVTSLCQNAQSVTAALNLWQRAQPVLLEEPETMVAAADPGVVRGLVEADRISYRYTAQGPLILDNVSIAIQPGQYVAIVGPSGCGKSTLLRLLLGFEQPRSGAIYYDGQDLAGLDLGALRRQIGVVLQNGRISGGTIFENIQAGSLLTREEALEAAGLAALDQDIEEMPMGLHTVLAEGGGTLSGGQRQRLLIARALAHKPKVIYLDEATSALDNETQRVVTESMERLKATRVVIAHRLSTIRNADYIYVMEKGRIAQHGTFDALMAEEGLFKRLVQRQLA